MTGGDFINSLLSVHSYLFIYCQDKSIEWKNYSLSRTKGSNYDSNEKFMREEEEER